MNAGEWFMYSIDEPLPRTLKIYTGSVHKRTFVREIKDTQARGYIRWHGNGPLYFSYKDGNGRWCDVRVVGDIDAWYGEEGD